MKNIYFVYLKKEKVKILNYQESLEYGASLLKTGWKHTSTINPAVVLEYLYNTDNLDIDWNTLHDILTV